MLRMLAAEARGHQHLDRVAEQLGACVSEELLGLSIDQCDTAVHADYHHRVRRRLEQRTELILSALALVDASDQIPRSFVQPSPVKEGVDSDRQ